VLAATFGVHPADPVGGDLLGADGFTFTAFKHDGQWFFHAPLLLTCWEGLAPAEQLEELAKGKDEVKLTYQEDDPLDQSASIYFDPQLRTVWLCGWLPWYFGTKPAYLYVTTANK